MSKDRRMTRQRQAIINMLAGTTAHPTAEMIYEAVRRELPDISLGTVYRNLQLLAAEGRIQKLTPRRGGSRFDGNVSPHSHFFCQSCGGVYDLPAYQASPPEEWRRRIPGRLVESRTDFFGICSDCLAKPSGGLR